jgi:hypothetical protein
MEIMESVTQVQRSSSATDSHGLPVWVETRTQVNAIVAARSSSLLTEADALTITQGLTLYLPSGTPIQDGDRFEVRGKTYVIDGEPFDWRDGLGYWNPGTVVNLTREQNGQ